MKKSSQYGPVFLQLIPLGGEFPCAPLELCFHALAFTEPPKGWPGLICFNLLCPPHSDVCGIAATATLWDVPSGNTSGDSSTHQGSVSLSPETPRVLPREFAMNAMTGVGRGALGTGVSQLVRASLALQIK